MASTRENDSSIGDADIKNLFIYLSNSRYFIEVVKSSSIITSIENSGLFNEHNIKSLKSIINEKAKNGFISFENFKSIWVSKLDDRPSVKDLRKHFINLIDELLSTNGYNKIDKNEFYLNKIILGKIIMYLEIKQNENEAILLAQDMIKSIDSNQDGKVSLKDFEFLIEEYLYNITDRQ